VSEKPPAVAVKEFISIFERTDGGEVSEKGPELHPSLGLGKGPKPREALPDNVVEAALDQCCGPSDPNRPHHGLLSIHRDTLRIETLGLECLEPGKDRVQALFGTVGTGDDLLALRVHKADVAAILVEVSSVVEKVAVLGIIPRFLGRLLKPVILDLLKLKGAVARKIRELTDGIALFNPQLEPVLFTIPLILRPFPDKALKALETAKSLLILFCFSIAFYSRKLTQRTMLFLASLAPCLLNRFN